MKLWEKEGSSTSKIIEQFTIGEDDKLDLRLAEFDVLGSIAHAKMLESIGLVTSAELEAILSGLNAILEEIKEGNFLIEEGVEDIHSQVELTLTKRIGESGKKIHSGRSRNDQILVDIRLYLRYEIKEIASLIESLFNRFLLLSETHKDKLLPGYTHFQIAMPSSFGLWFGAYAESLVDDVELLVAAQKIVNKNPLGSGAGYGSSFPLNRKLTTELLGFSTLNHNVVYAQMTRGKVEKTVSIALSSIAATLSKFAYDVCLYMNQNFAFLSFPDNLTTGSSIMPHKKNPDVFEIIRAKCNKIQALPNELTLIINNLPSGYHRDFQLTKECLFPAIDNTKSCLSITEYMLQHIQPKNDLLDDEKYKLIFSVESVNNKVLKGVPFRDAYKEVAEEIRTNSFSKPAKLNHTHEGSIGNLHLREIKSQMEKILHLLK